MSVLASVDDIMKVVLVVFAVLVLAAFVAWKVYAVAKAARNAKGSPLDRHRAVGNALYGGDTYGKAHQTGWQAGEKLVSLFKRKRK